MMRCGLMSTFVLVAGLCVLSATGFRVETVVQDSKGPQQPDQEDADAIMVSEAYKQGFQSGVEHERLEKSQVNSNVAVVAQGVGIVAKPSENVSTWDWMQAVAGGTGAAVRPGDTSVNQDLLRRMRYQDKAVMFLLVCAYLGSLFFSAIISYRQADNDSSVVYYADPRYHNLTTDGGDVEDFLDAFNQVPKDIHLRVSGLYLLPPLPEYMMDTAVDYLEARYGVAFSFALDLTPWLVRDGADHNASPTVEQDPVQGVPTEEAKKLRQYLERDSNDLSFVRLKKEVEWKDWEELATNIKSQIRHRGFTGKINVTRSSKEIIDVHKNKAWANFMHSRTTKVILALSVVGWLFYQPYMWLRHKALTVVCKHRVDISIDEFWGLIEGQIGASGFDSRDWPAQTPPPRLSSQRYHQQQAALRQEHQAVLRQQLRRGSRL